MITRIRLLLLSLLCLLLLAVPAGATTNYVLTVTVQGSGTVSTNPTFASYRSGVTITLTATPSTGWYFAGWSGAINATTNQVNVTMTDNLSVTGSFLAYPVYSLTLTTNGQGSIGLSPSGGSYYGNTLVTATATPAGGWVFTGWSGATNDTMSPVSLTLDSSLALTGTFAELPAFDVEPPSLTNAIGSTVNFTSHAVGTAPVAYQWYFGNSPLMGDTNAALALTNVSALAAGFYQVTATNLYGSATSSLAALVLTNASESTNVVSVCNEADLRSAISAGGWVSLGCSGTITLSGTIYITKNVILDGTGVSATISGGNAVQLFYVEPGVSFSMTNLTLANGSCVVTNGNAIAAGGAIFNNGGIVRLTGCTVTNNRALASISGGIAQGGAIYNGGGAIGLYGTTVLNNTAFGEYNSNPPQFGQGGGQGFGGAIFNTNGTVVIINSLLQSNVCGNMGGEGSVVASGGALYQAAGTLLVTNSILADNLALGGPNEAMYYSEATPAYGGALTAIGGGVSLDLCQVVGNTAQGGNNTYDQVAASAFGGAVYCTSSLTAVRCAFSGNQALAGNGSVVFEGDTTAPTASGGAIYNAGSVILKSCLISSNDTLGGTGSPYGDNGPANGGNGLGGGIFNAAQMAATNCTVALNTAFGNIGGYGSHNGSAIGGGIYNASNATFLTVNVTIASNFCNAVGNGTSSLNGFAAGAQIANTNGSVSLLNSLLAYGSTNGNACGVITDLGDNISSDGTANFESGSSYNNTDPLLGALANNGGPTLTMALLPDSAAIAYANSAGAPPDDQRGFARPSGIGVIDLGACQTGATQIYYPPPVLSLSIAAAFPKVVVSFTTSPQITNTIHFQESTNLINWIDLQTIGALASPSNISQTISPSGTRQQFFRLWW